MKNLKIVCGTVAGFLAAFSFLNLTQAATMSVTSLTPSQAVGGNWDVNVRIDSTGQSVNATQGTLTYPRDILDVVGVYRQNSIFNIWLQNPSVSTSTGEVSFLAGSTNSFSGPSLYVLTVSFRVRATGKATIGFKDAGITSGDGTGANVLSDTVPLTANFGKNVAVTAPKEETSTTSTTATTSISAIQLPTQIKREATPSIKLPTKPVIVVPLYPDASNWYAQNQPFFANWELPSDVVQVAASLNTNPDFTPVTTEGLFDSKQFPGLADGVSYLHVRFKNGMGWGPTAHYRIRVDTTPPAALKIDMKEGTSTTNPQPTLSFYSADSLSGVSHYTVSIDKGAALETTAAEYTLPLQEPGNHVAKVAAVDKAGNLVVGSMVFNIIPIDSPTIDPISAIPFVGESGLTVSGTSLPNVQVTINLQDVKNSKNSVTMSTMADLSGRWATQFTQPMAKGNYFITAMAMNSAQARSLSARTPVFSVRERPLFAMGGLVITLGNFTIFLMVLLALVFVGGALFGRWLLSRMRVRALITERDLMAAMSRIERSIKVGLANLDTSKTTEHEVSEARNAFLEVRKAMGSVQRYVAKEIEEITD